MQDIQMDKNIYEGRPQNEGSRLPKELAVYDLLDRLQISYRRVDHEPLMTIEACQAVDQLLGVEDLQESVFVQPAADPVLFVADAGQKVI